MSPRRGRRRPQPRVYLRLGCVGCSIPLLAVLATIAAAALLGW